MGHRVIHVSGSERARAHTRTIKTAGTTASSEVASGVGLAPGSDPIGGSPATSLRDALIDLHPGDMVEVVGERASYDVEKVRGQTGVGYEAFIVVSEGKSSYLEYPLEKESEVSEVVGNFIASSEAGDGVPPSAAHNPPIAGDDIADALADSRHLGFGYATKDAFGSTMQKKLDRAVSKAATEGRFTKEEFFIWANSKQGRWLVDHASGLTSASPSRDYDEVASKYVSRAKLNDLVMNF